MMDHRLGVKGDVKLWLANRILDCFYKILAWSMQQRLAADLESGSIQFVPFEQQPSNEERARMN